MDLSENSFYDYLSDLHNLVHEVIKFLSVYIIPDYLGGYLFGSCKLTLKIFIRSNILHFKQLRYPIDRIIPDFYILISILIIFL
jgi:hypothetical protein